MVVPTSSFIGGKYLRGRHPRIEFPFASQTKVQLQDWPKNQFLRPVEFHPPSRYHSPCRTKIKLESASEVTLEHFCGASPCTVSGPPFAAWPTLPRL